MKVTNPLLSARRASAAAKAMVFACAAVLVLASSARAADKTWVGAQDAAWDTGSNWSPSGVPGLSDRAVFATSASVTYALPTSYPPAVGAVWVQSTAGTVTIPANVDNSVSSGAAFGDVTVDGGATLVILSSVAGGISSVATTVNTLPGSGAVLFQNSNDRFTVQFTGAISFPGTLKFQHLHASLTTIVTPSSPTATVAVGTLQLVAGGTTAIVQFGGATNVLHVTTGQTVIDHDSRLQTAGRLTLDGGVSVSYASLLNADTIAVAGQCLFVSSPNAIQGTGVGGVTCGSVASTGTATINIESWIGPATLGVVSGTDVVRIQAGAGHSTATVSTATGKAVTISAGASGTFAVAGPVTPLGAVTVGVSGSGPVAFSNPSPLSFASLAVTGAAVSFASSLSTNGAAGIALSGPGNPQVTVSGALSMSGGGTITFGSGLTAAAFVQANGGVHVSP